MRWRQDRHTGEFIPIDEQAARQDAQQGKNLNVIRGNFEAFKSPIDGSIISTQRGYDNHNKKHDVVNAAEFSPEYYAEKAKERENFFKGHRPKKEIFKARQAIYETWTAAERD